MSRDPLRNSLGCTRRATGWLIDCDDVLTSSAPRVLYPIQWSCFLAGNAAQQFLRVVCPTSTAAITTLSLPLVCSHNCTTFLPQSPLPGRSLLSVGPLHGPPLEECLEDLPPRAFSLTPSLCPLGTGCPFLLGPPRTSRSSSASAGPSPLRRPTQRFPALTSCARPPRAASPASNSPRSRPTG